jgi:hypothetical protein
MLSRIRLQALFLAAFFVATTAWSWRDRLLIRTATAATEAMPVDSHRSPAPQRAVLRPHEPEPEKRAELRLVIKAGSILEDDDQQGLAHFVEHMAFNGTKNFPKQEIISFIESLGMRFGADLNAYTSFDETVYMLQVPTDKAATMDRALLILEDCTTCRSNRPRSTAERRDHGGMAAASRRGARMDQIPRP